MISIKRLTTHRFSNLKRYAAVLALILSLSAPLFAQDVTVKWGNLNKRKNKWTEARYIVGRDETGFYVFSSRFHGISHIYLERYNNDNNLEWNKELELPESDGKRVDLEKIIYLDGKLLLFTSHYNRKLDKNIAYVNTISEDGKVNNDQKQIDYISSGKKMNAGNFDFILSHDSANVLVYHNEPYDKNAQDKFSLKVLNSDLEITWKKDISVPYLDQDFYISNYIVSPDEKVYMLAKIQEGKREKKGGKPNYKYTILSYGEEDDKPKEFLISLADKFISDISFEIDKENNLVCAGFYSKKNSADIAGTFYLVIDSDDEKVISRSIKDFDEKTLSQFMSSRKARKKRELYDYELRRLIPKSDGGSLLVAEQFYVRVVSSTDPKTGFTTYTYYYNYNDIIIVDIDKKGEIGWVTRIPKLQVSTNDEGYYSSFALSIDANDKVYIVYNDNRKNLLKPGKRIKSMSNLRKAMPALVIVDGRTGEYTKKALFDLKEKKVYLKPKLYMKTGPNEMVIYATRMKKYMFGTINFH
jgi:hypothetical protein